MKTKFSTLLLFAILLASCSAIAQTIKPSKLSPSARLLLMERNETAQSKGLQGNPPPAMMEAFIEVTHESTYDALAAFGCLFGCKVGKLATARIPMGWVDSISRRQDVVYVEAAQKMHPMLDSARSMISAQAVYDGKGLKQPYTGKGVLVGVIDVGFDYTHPTCYNPEGTHYRVVRAISKPNASTTIVYSDSASILAAQHSADAAMQYHGSHVIGIAAGGGYTTPYRGVAYESPIMLYQVINSDMELIEGMKAIFDYADSIGLPVSVNCSAGNELGPHDNTSIISRMINALTGPGKIFVVSAGNLCGEHQQYSFKTVGDTSYISLQEVTDKDYELDLWSGKAGGTFSVAIKLYDSRQMKYTDSSLYFSASADTTYVKNFVVDGKIYCYAFVPQLSPFDSKRNVRISCANLDNDSCFMELFVTSPDSVTHTWCSFPDCQLLKYNDSGIPENNDAMTITDEACSENAISVASFNSRTSIVNNQGKTILFNDGAYNEISSFSSLGPTAAGIIKPDVTAPGSNLVSSWNSFCVDTATMKLVPFVQPTIFHDRSYDWGALAGTSMAAPVVTGTIALWLEANPKLTPKDIKGIISRTSTQRAGLAYPNNIWGYGSINAYKGLLDILGIDGIGDVFSSRPQEAVSVYRGSVPGELHVRWADTPKHYSIEVCDALGRVLAHSKDVHPSSNDITLTLPEMSLMTYFIRIVTEKGKTMRKVMGTM